MRALPFRCKNEKTNELLREKNLNDKENFKAIEAFNTNSNKLLEVGEQFRHNYFDDPLSLVFVYKYIIIKL